jgi:putative endonuclease
MKRGGAIYIMTNSTHTTLYVGVTSDLKKRVWEHKNFIFSESFTSKYKLTYLVYYEGFHRIEEAIAREKQIKGGSRKRKENLIKSINPNWNDLYNDVLKW